jgi:hypothetical protein
LDQLMSLCFEHSLISPKAVKSYGKLKHPLIFTNMED